MTADLYEDFVHRPKLLIKDRRGLIAVTLSNVFTMRLTVNKTQKDKHNESARFPAF